MKRSTLNLGPFGIYLWGGIMLVGGLAVAGGAALTANPAGTIHTQQLANGTARVGQIVRAGACTDTATSTTTTNRQCWVDFPESGSLPSGTPGQVAGIKTVTVSTTTTGTSTATASATAYQAVNGTLYAGSNVTLSKGTSTATSTAVDMADSPRIHAASAAYSFSTVTPAAVGTSGSVGTSTLLQRADHVHQGDGNDKVRIYNGYTPGYLYDLVFSSTGSINVGLSSQKLNLGANFGTGANTVCEGNDSRLSNARMPTTHASTHVTGGTDVIANAVASGDSGLMTGADKAKLDSTTTTPTAYSIPATGSTKYLNTWIRAASASVAGLLSTAHYNLISAASATPGIGVLAKGDANGRLDGWVVGQLVSSTKYVTDSMISASGAAWGTPDTFTFTASGTKYRISATAYITGTTNGYGDAQNRFCGLGILAATGSSVSTATDVKDAGWAGATYYNVFNSPSIISGRYVLGVVNAEATFTLGSTGTVTIGLALYKGDSYSSAACEAVAGMALMYVDIYD